MSIDQGNFLRNLKVNGLLSTVSQHAAIPRCFAGDNQKEITGWLFRLFRCEKNVAKIEEFWSSPTCSSLTTTSPHHCIHVTFISVFFKALLGLLSCATLYCWVIITFVNMSNMSTFSTRVLILSHNSLHQSLQICGQWDLSHPTFNLFLIVWWLPTQETQFPPWDQKSLTLCSTLLGSAFHA